MYLSVGSDLGVDLLRGGHHGGVRGCGRFVGSSLLINSSILLGNVRYTEIGNTNILYSTHPCYSKVIANINYLVMSKPHFNHITGLKYNFNCHFPQAHM